MKTNYGCSLILAAHGSITTACANQPLFDLARRIEQHEIFLRVTPAFLYGDPEIKNVLDTLPEIGDVVVVPVMTSEGYYSQRVFPRMLADNRSADQHRVFVSPALGMHADVPRLVAKRMSKLMGLLNIEPAETTVVFVGHGTTRHPKSGRATMDLAAKVQSLAGEFEYDRATFRVAFLDQPPLAATAAARIQTKHTLVIPFLVSRGPHTTVDVPEAFGLPSGPQIEYPLVETLKSQAGAEGYCICDLPIGMYPEMSDLCLELATDQLLSGTPMRFPNAATEGASS